MKNSCGKVFHFYFADQQKQKEEKHKKIIKEQHKKIKWKMGKHGIYIR